MWRQKSDCGDITPKKSLFFNGVFGVAATGMRLLRYGFWGKSAILIMVFRVDCVMNKYDGIDKRIVANVKTYARNLKRNTIFRSMELEDIEQELMCAAFSSLDKFDERYGKFEHFIGKVLTRRCATLIETYTRKKRNSIIKFSEYRDEGRGDDFNKF